MYLVRKEEEDLVGILFKQSLKLKAGLTKSETYKSFEVADYTMNYSTFATRMLVIYRSPLSADGTTINLFLSEFSNLLEQIVTDPKPIIIFGDFNLHVDLPNYVAALKFLDLLETVGLKQHVNVATHRCGHTLLGRLRSIT